MLRGSNRNVLIQILCQVWEACLDLQPQACFSSTYRWHFDLQVSLALISFCVTSGEAQAEERVGKCAAQWTSIPSIAGPPASRIPPQVPPWSLWPQQLPLSWEQHRFVRLFLTFTQVDIYSACSVRPLVLLLSVASAVCIQIVQGRVSMSSLSVFFYPACHLSLSDWITVYLPIFFRSFPILF